MVLLRLSERNRTVRFKDKKQSSLQSLACVRLSPQRDLSIHNEQETEEVTNTNKRKDHCEFAIPSILQSFVLLLCMSRV